MWIMSPRGFVSIVDKGDRPGMLCVRARRRACLEALFPGVEIIDGGGTDYPFRCYVSRPRAAAVVSAEINAIDYSNHKGATKDPALKNAYSIVWGVMMRLQERVAEFMQGSLFGGPARRFRNYYRCPCGAEWTDIWSATCDDDCPCCGTICEPEHSEDV